MVVDAPRFKQNGFQAIFTASKCGSVQVKWIPRNFSGINAIADDETSPFSFVNIFLLGLIIDAIVDFAKFFTPSNHITLSWLHFNRVSIAFVPWCLIFIFRFLQLTRSTVLIQRINFYKTYKELKNIGHTICSPKNINSW